MKIIYGADFFCGGGGFTEGFKKYFLDHGIQYHWKALNHWDKAIATHSLNHPEAEHYELDIYAADPKEVIPSGYLDILTASPECTYHSVARGGGQCDDQSRCQARDLLRWASAIDIRAIVLENVKEFIKWGPLDESGQPVKEKSGQYFVDFLQGLTDLGYKIEYRILTAADFGAWTSRERFFLIARKDGQQIKWPEISHSKNPEALGLLPWKPAKEIIDWSIKGESVFLRQAGKVLDKRTGKPKKALSENTIKRICYGLEKFSGLKLEPYLVMLYGQSKARSIDLPLPSITAPDGHLAVCEPFLYPCNHADGNEKRVYSINNPVNTLTTKSSYYIAEPFLTKLRGTNKVSDLNQPLATISTSGNHFGLVQPFLVQYHGGEDLKRRVYSLDDPMKVVDTSNRYAVCEPFLIKNYSTGENICSINDPLDTVTTKDRFSLIQPVGDYYQLDILYRMLLPHELAAAMGFRRDYKFVGTITDIKKQIGNAVEVNQSYAMASAVVPGILAAGF